MNPDLVLFPDLVPADREPPIHESEDRRRTRRRRLQLASGVHPLMLTATDPDPAHRCGTCEHITRNERGFLKCARSLITRGAATDVRASWPGCMKWKGTE